jgi:hypothetical protein
MLEIVTRYSRNRRKTAEQKLLPFITEVNTPENSIQQSVDIFKKKIVTDGNNLVRFSFILLSQLAREKEVSQGAFFISDVKNGKPVLKFLTGFASPNSDNNEDILEIGEGFPGQVAKDGKLINISDIPDGYLSIESGLGKASPVSLIIFPVKHVGKVLAVIELASFHKFTKEDELFFENISPSIAEQIIKCLNK